MRTLQSRKSSEDVPSRTDQASGPAGEVEEARAAKSPPDS
jgi:hypothetical protein